ncbi:hypothetical protein BDV37DRAFT_281280 [Aspergillus pseudonomiae]|uniref:Glucose-methanol-choline oxidoreductase C-terminal domain-containing protein n=1 Tax=Aspergillus pseudonomiae TaxID=1506151 RepID=A0A5N7DKF9_9EURO|nr:uncharacterized protein BDV37DRAFT_281280 [Aspergillus pseudonomiae]KAE8406038.1 hypothetical protein BDV37DRAFT_281280 [Aspergillus pseudonomiae]
MDAYLTNDVELVAHLSKQNHYDYVVVGSGFGGGVLAQKLVEGKDGKAPKVLVIEKGGLSFSTHCLNTARPSWQVGSVQGPSQDNDVVYNAVKQKVHTAAGSDPFLGGPVYCLGGRSNVWGLFSPQENPEQTQNFFPEKISKYLNEKGYKEAFKLLTNDSQKNPDQIYPKWKKDEQSPSIDLTGGQMATAIKAVEDALGEWDRTGVEVSAAPMAAQFSSSKPYDFPQGAYSTVDRLLQLSYARSPNLTILTNVEGLSFSYQPPKNSGGSYTVDTLTVRDSSNRKELSIHAKLGIILCAGTLDTARIALRSELQKLNPLVGKGLTDHEIWGVRLVKEKNHNQNLIHPLKLQSEITIDDSMNSKVLLNVAVNANTFLGRSSTVYSPPTQCYDPTGHRLNRPPAQLQEDPENSCNNNTVNVTFQYCAELDDSSEVYNIPAETPVVYIRRANPDIDVRHSKMQQIASSIFRKILDITRIPDLRLTLVPFGAVAHEVGTMRLQRPKKHTDSVSNKEDKYVVDDEYRVRNFDNLYVCDLSIFPVSPPANPSLTLAAMALQLADNLLNRVP